MESFAATYSSQRTQDCLLAGRLEPVVRDSCRVCCKTGVVVITVLICLFQIFKQNLAVKCIFCCLTICKIPFKNVYMLLKHQQKSFWHSGASPAVPYCMARRNFKKWDEKVIDNRIVRLFIRVIACKSLIDDPKEGQVSVLHKTQTKIKRCIP